MLALLIGGGLVYLALGDVKEAIILLVFACLSVVITVVQETRTERVLEALRDLTSPRALVIRDGERQRIAGREVVRGDLIVLSEGDRVPADARLLEALDLQVDKSLLTGSRASAQDRRLPGAPPAPRRRGFAHRLFGNHDRPWRRHRRSSATGAFSEIGRSARDRDRDGGASSATDRRDDWLAFLPYSGGVVALLGRRLYGLCAAAGSTRFWPGSRSACRCCRKSFRWS